jgi:hypothetical protein
MLRAAKGIEGSRVSGSSVDLLLASSWRLQSLGPAFLKTNHEGAIKPIKTRPQAGKKGPAQQNSPRQAGGQAVSQPHMARRHDRFEFPQRCRENE